VVVLVAVGAAVYLANPGHVFGDPVSPLRQRIMSIAESQVGYRTDPSDTYCNRYSAYWSSGTDDCGNENLDEEWCADFAAWVWQQAGAAVVYRFQPGDLNSDTASFYLWGVDHGTWHPLSSGYVAQPGDVAIYGLDASTLEAVHVAIVVSDSAGAKGPDVVNGDGDRTGFSEVDYATDQHRADVRQPGGILSGYVSPTAPPTVGGAGSS